ncbi:MAG: hypothetical protein DRN30_06665 [Thermoplasmata archaeon]|nr:MAG: hypothetical protein DRN30_06665 [Thermoplasmata archaeon]
MFGQWNTCKQPIEGYSRALWRCFFSRTS